jgi:putative ABC transport system permease protein
MNSTDLVLRLRSLVFHGRAMRELDEELRAHLEMQTLREMRNGLSREEAERAARRTFGNTTLVAEACREQRGIRWLEDFLQDVTYGARQLWKEKGFTAIAVFTLALGIGANCAIFSTVEGVLLRPFPYQEQDRLVTIFSAIPSKGIPQMGSAIPDLRDLTRRSHSFTSVAAYFYGDANLSDGSPEHVKDVHADAKLFPLLGVQAALGRTFTDSENAFGNHRVALLSDAFWKRRFGGRPGVLHQTLHINGELFGIIGVMAPDFQFPDEGVDLWVPLAFAAGDIMATRDNHYVNAIGRLKPNVTLPQARGEAQTIGRALEHEFNENTSIGMDANDYLTSVVGDVRRPLLVLLAAAGVVLLIACLNVANLLFARASGRRRELAVRAALGAGRWRLVRQLLSESLLLGMAGAALGVALSFLLIRLIRLFGPSGIPRLQTIGIDAYVLLFALGVAIASVLLFGLMPALNLAHAHEAEALKEGGRSQSSGAGAKRFRNVLVISEIALSLVLVVGAGLLIRTYEHLNSVESGFQANNVLTFRVSLPDAGYDSSAKIVHFYDELMRRLEQLQGVKAAGATTAIPIGGDDWGKSFTIDEHPAARLADVPLIHYRQVTAHYIRAMGIPLRQGRLFTEGDVEGQPMVALINEAARQRFFPHESPLGKRVYPGAPESVVANFLPSPDFRIPRLTIIGVIGDVRHAGLEQPPTPEMYVPDLQGTVKDNQGPLPGMVVVLKTNSDPANFVHEARGVLHSLDPDLPMADIASMDERVRKSLASKSFQLFLFGGFAFIALALAAVGVYGVMSYSVRLRTPELGVRIALGAQRSAVLSLVARHGLVLGLAGILVGTALAFGLTRLMRSLLFGVEATDLLTFLGAVLVLLAAVALACVVPSLRATRIDPLAVLRAD